MFSKFLYGSILFGVLGLCLKINSLKSSIVFTPSLIRMDLLIKIELLVSEELI